MPPAAPANVQNYGQLLVRSRLLSADEVQTALRRWQESGKGDPDDVEGFRKFLVAGKQLTDYQAALVQRGHTEGFFLDAYKVLDLIGKGRLAGVYKAAHSSGQLVAIKVLPTKKAKDVTTLGRFQREGRMLTRLDHPNVVRAFQVGETGGKHYLVMEYLEGEPLDEVLDRRKRLPPLEAMRIAYQALMGLQHVHEKGLVHRDIKPANLMLTPAPGQPDTTLRSTVKILDIGLGRTVFDENATETEEQLTSTGGVLGTPDYLAPEQAQDAHRADIRADIYSAGCVLYHMLTGQVPFPDSNVTRQALRHATEVPKPLGEFLQPVPEGLEQVLSWLMAKNPAQRYPTPERAAQALQIFLLNNPEAGTASVPSPVSPAFLAWLQGGGAGEAPRSAPTMAYTTPTPAPAAKPEAGASPPPAPTAPAVTTPSTGSGPLPSWLENENIPVGKLEPRKTERPRERSAEVPRPKDKEPPKPVPLPRPAPAPLALDEFDVELVPVPPPAPQLPAPSPAPAQDERGLFELNRRDWLMLGLGGGGVLFAILTGYGIAQLVRPRSQPSVSEDDKKQQPKTE